MTLNLRGLEEVFRCDSSCKLFIHFPASMLVEVHIGRVSDNLHLSHDKFVLHRIEQTIFSDNER